MRSKWKGIFFNNIIFELLSFKLNNRITRNDIYSGNSEKIDMYNYYDNIIRDKRKIIIIDYFLNIELSGVSSKAVLKFTEEKVGHRVGEFYFNKKTPIFGAKKNKKKKKK